jgi:hypothetical protein
MGGGVNVGGCCVGLVFDTSFRKAGVRDQFEALLPVKNRHTKVRIVAGVSGLYDLGLATDIGLVVRLMPE